MHLHDATVVRGLRDTAQAFLRSGSTAVLSGESIHLPGELAREAIPFVLHLPDRGELQLVVHQILRSLKRQHEIFFVDLPEAAEREAIFRIHLQLRRQDPAKFDLDALTAASEGFSGAEIEQAITAGLYRALHDRQPLTTAILCEEMRGTQPLSVSRREDVERLREMARGRFVPA
ncbi:MAG TPA: hypothetical protein VGJ78_02050 [Vicinamibacterales bacterium]